MAGPGSSDPNRPVVYDSAVGRVCPTCGRPSKDCACRPKRPAFREASKNVPRNDGIVRVSRDRRNRRGKTVTVVTGVPGSEAALDELAGTLKRLCGCGGTAKDGVIEIQGDHRDLVVSKLMELGYRVKIAGG